MAHTSTRNVSKILKGELNTSSVLLVSTKVCLLTQLSEYFSLHIFISRSIVGTGQEAVKYYTTPEGTPSGPPVNISHIFQTPDVLSITWDPPIREHRNGQILRYDIQFHKKIDHGLGTERNTTVRKAVFANLDQNTEYVVRIRAYTKQGAGPFSEKIIIETERDMGRAPMQVQAIATSEQTVEVWWESGEKNSSNIICRTHKQDFYCLIEQFRLEEN